MACFPSDSSFAPLSSYSVVGVFYVHVAIWIRRGRRQNLVMHELEVEPEKITLWLLPPHGIHYTKFCPYKARWQSLHEMIGRLLILVPCYRLWRHLPSCTLKYRMRWWWRGWWNGQRLADASMIMRRLYGRDWRLSTTTVTPCSNIMRTRSYSARYDSQ